MLSDSIDNAASFRCEFCEVNFEKIADMKKHVADKHHDKLNW
jgi:hypothetical protein